MEISECLVCLVHCSAVLKSSIYILVRLQRCVKSSSQFISLMNTHPGSGRNWEGILPMQTGHEMEFWAQGMSGRWRYIEGGNRSFLPTAVPACGLSPGTPLQHHRPRSLHAVYRDQGQYKHLKGRFEGTCVPVRHNFLFYHNQRWHQGKRGFRGGGSIARVAETFR